MNGERHKPSMIVLEGDVEARELVNAVKKKGAFQVSRTRKSDQEGEQEGEDCVSNKDVEGRGSHIKGPRD